jgi:hypothetical protein
VGAADHGTRIGGLPDAGQGRGEARCSQRSTDGNAKPAQLGGAPLAIVIGVNYWPTIPGAQHVVFSVATADVPVMPGNGSFERPTVLVLPPTDEWRVTDRKLPPNDIRPAAANDPSSNPR